MDAYDLEGRVAVVTGASSGIGRATALELSRRGAKVVLAARHLEPLEDLEREIVAAGGIALAFPADVSDRGQVDALVRQARRRFERIDVLVANAGMYFRKPVRELKLDEVERVMAVNFAGAVATILDVLPEMLERGSGRIAVVSSVDGKKGIPPDAAYVASKFALGGFCEVLRQELVGTGVAVSVVYPGRVDTPMIGDLEVPAVSAKITPERVAKALVEGIERGRAEVYVPSVGPRALVMLNTVSPELGDWLVRVLGLSGRERPAGTRR